MIATTITHNTSAPTTVMITTSSFVSPKDLASLVLLVVLLLLGAAVGTVIVKNGAITLPVTARTLPVHSSASGSMASAAVKDCVTVVS
jgi:hypothetical protein